MPKQIFRFERIEILPRYQSATLKGLEKKIKEGAAPEHPAWEDLIATSSVIGFALPEKLIELPSGTPYIFVPYQIGYLAKTEHAVHN